MALKPKVVQVDQAKSIRLTKLVTMAVKSVKLVELTPKSDKCTTL